MSTVSDADTYSNRQVMLSLAYLAYCGDEITTADPDAEIAQLITDGISKIPALSSETGSANWATVWGPISYTTPGALYQDSLMYVAQNQTTASQYVVAIRGTNQVSDLDWLMDDFDVLQQMPWPPGSANPTGAISESISIGLQTLLTMSDGSNTLLQYLDSVTGDPIALTVTGHSLGGALASALGLYLTEEPKRWDRSTASTVACVTFAAPTAGDDRFAGLVEDAFPGTTAATVFDRVQCSMDIVPLAWTAANIVNLDESSSQILDLYDTGPDGSVEDGIDFQEMETPEDYAWTEIVLPYMLPAVQNLLTPGHYTQPFAGAAQLITTNNPTWQAYGQNLQTTAAAFGDQAAFQHSQSYPILLGVLELLDPSIINETGTATASSRRASRPRARLLQTLLMAAFDGITKAPTAAATDIGRAGTPPQ